MDFILMYVVFVTLTDKGYKMEDLLIGDERERFFEVMRINEIDDESESIILLETLNLLFEKAGVRKEVISEYLN
jgi:hypothetical protein